MKLIDLIAQNRLSEAKDLIFKKLEEKIAIRLQDEKNCLSE